MTDIQIKTHLYISAWKNLGLPMNKKLKSLIDSFLLSPQYKGGYDTYWSNPVLFRGVPDDLTLQRFKNYLTEEFLAFLVARHGLDTPDFLPRAGNGETSV